MYLRPKLVKKERLIRFFIYWMEIPSFIPWLVLRVSSLLLKPQTYLLASLWLLNTDRTRDFTPTCSAARRDGTICPYDKPAGGGAEQFHRFLIEELRLEVENKVPANGTNFLVGHSYAGLFTLQTLSNHPESFDSYIAIDPSLWWDRGVFLQQAAKNVYQKDFSSKHLYVAFATRQRPAIKLIQFSLADSLKNKIIPEMKNKHLHVIYKKFPDEVHGTIALPAIFDGLKSLFHNTISTKEAT